MIINDPSGWETGNVSQPQLGTCSLPAPAIYGVGIDVTSILPWPSLLLPLIRLHLPFFFSGVKTKRDRTFSSMFLSLSTFFNLIHLHFFPCPQIAKSNSSSRKPSLNALPAPSVALFWALDTESLLLQTLVSFWWFALMPLGLGWGLTSCVLSSISAIELTHREDPSSCFLQEVPSPAQGLSLSLSTPALPVHATHCVLPGLHRET